MEYKAVFNDQCLYHVNNNHDKLGRFAPGDGDGDGMIDDVHNRNKSSSNSYRETTKYKSGAKRLKKRNC